MSLANLDYTKHYVEHDREDQELVPGWWVLGYGEFPEETGPLVSICIGDAIDEDGESISGDVVTRVINALMA